MGKLRVLSLSVIAMFYRQNFLLGAGLILLSELCFATMGALVKHLTGTLPVVEVAFMRGLFGLLLLLPLGWRQAGRQTLVSRVPGLHLLRTALGVSALYCFFYALSRLPLADGMLLKMTSPLFMPLIATLWLAERLRGAVWLAVGIGFLGVVLVVAPTGQLAPAALAGLAGGLFAAGAKVTVRRLARSEPTLRIVFWFSLGMVVATAMPLLWHWRTPDTGQWAWLGLMGLFGTLGQLFLTRGYGLAAASRLAPFTYASVVFGAVYGFLFWDETLDGGFVAGALLIGLAGGLALRLRRETAA